MMNEVEAANLLNNALDHVKLVPSNNDLLAFIEIHECLEFGLDPGALPTSVS